MKLRVTNVLKKLNGAKDKKIVGLWGGSSSSKTISALQYATIIAMNDYSKPIFTIIGESIPVLKRSVIRDWRGYVMGDYYSPDLYNKNEMIYQFPTGALFQFVPADDADRFHGPRQDYALFDEAYNIKRGIFDQVDIRTRRKIILTWNPVSPFWATNLDSRPDTVLLHSTYKDNPYLEKSIIDSLELRANRDPDFYRVYVLGQYGSVQGLIFKHKVHWDFCDDFPKDSNQIPVYQWRAFGLDFGFTVDPSALIEVRYSNGEIWVREHLYERGQTNDILARHIKEANKDNSQVIADIAEPKSIEEIRRLNINIVASLGGADSINYGIGVLKQYKINVFRDSLNLIKELRNYSLASDKHGEFTNKPVDNWNHAIDALRNVVTFKQKYKADGKYVIN